MHAFAPITLRLALCLAPALCIAPLATAADTTDLAEVISVTPLKEFINEPRRECWTETVTEYRETTRYQENERYSSAGAVIGGVTGGVIGNSMGSGHGRTAATVAGAVIGAIVGDRIDNNEYYAEPEVQREPITRQVERCKSQDRYRAVVKRYHVVYRYNGREGEVYLPYDPGSHVRIGARSVEDSEGAAPSPR